MFLILSDDRDEGEIPIFLDTLISFHFLYFSGVTEDKEI